MASSRTSAALVAVRAALPRGGALPEHAWDARHRGICALLWAHVAGLAVVGWWRDVPAPLVALECCAVAAFAAAAMWESRSRTFRSSMAVLGLLTSTAALIASFHGLIEAHFHFFVVIAVVSLYQAWRPYLLAVAFVLVHHLALGTLMPVHVYNHAMAIDRPWLFALVHSIAVLAESLACLVFWRLTEDALDAERVNRDALVQTNEELIRANRAVADLVAMLSHDLRVPLSVIIGYSEMALESWPTMSEAEQIDFVNKVNRAGTALHTMLDDTLTVSALDADGVEPRRGPVRVDEAVLKAVSDLPATATIDVQRLESATAVVDRGHLDQILNNLVSNAVKYGGGRFAVSSSEELDNVVIQVSDSGPGVPAAFVAQLFERFTRAEDARSGAQKGTGLGLYITRSLLLANEGAISYTPTEGGGSTFLVQLPRFRRSTDPLIPPLEQTDDLTSTSTG
jgi:signal transduction histidine kinase